jgi:RNA chaperone Hfq
MNKPSSGTINIQDPFFYQLRKESKTVHVYLVSGKRLTGIIRRFDRYLQARRCQHRSDESVTSKESTRRTAALNSR